MPIPLHELFAGIPGFYVQTDWSSQPTMMQVAGGMDRLPAALAARLGNRITYRAAVREIRQGERGVWVVYADPQGQPRRIEADYCISTIPLPVLADIQKDVTQPVQSAIATAGYDGAGKIGLQFKRRFWERDDEIYGGRSWTDQEVGQIIYPSHGFTTAKGILVGYYLDFRGTMRARPPAEIQRIALDQGARVHPQYPTEFEHAFSVTWARVPWSRGSWRSESPDADAALAPLREPDGRVYFAGDYMTDMSSWMQERSSPRGEPLPRFTGARSRRASRHAASSARAVSRAPRSSADGVSPGASLMFNTGSGRRPGCLRRVDRRRTARRRAPGRRGHSARAVRVVEQPHDGLRERRRFTRRHQESGLAVDHRLGNPAGTGANDGQAHRHRVEESGSEAFGNGAHHEEFRRLHQREHVFAEARQPHRPLEVQLLDLFLKRGPQLAFAEDDEVHVRQLPHDQRHRVEQVALALVADERADVHEDGHAVGKPVLHVEVE